MSVRHEMHDTFQILCLRTRILLQWTLCLRAFQYQWIPYIWNFSRGFNFRWVRDLSEIAKIYTAKNNPHYTSSLTVLEIARIGLWKFNTPSKRHFANISRCKQFPIYGFLKNCINQCFSSWWLWPRSWKYESRMKTSYCLLRFNGLILQKRILLFS